jgi:hypothetical protein
VNFQYHAQKLQEIALRHEEYFPRNTPLFMQVLKGHLLVEELVRETLAAHLRYPKALNGEKGASLSCHQAICLAEAILREEKLEAWVWDGMKKLNALRNRLAHRLTGVELEKEVEAFTSYVTSQKPDLPDAAKEAFPSARSYFEICVMEVSASLSTIDFYSKIIAESTTV